MKSVVAFMFKNKYTIAFNECIYNDYRDGLALDKCARELLQPKVYNALGGLTDMAGYFIKDNIRVDTYWESMFDSYWIADTDDEEIKKKVFEWAVMVNNEYLKLKKE